MKKSRVLINYTEESDAGIQVVAKSVIAGCTNNTSFVFTKSELVNVVSAEDDYANILSTITSGNHSDITLKNEARNKLENAMRVLCTEINRQHAGNTAVLQTSGAPLTAGSLQSKGGDKPPAEGLKADAGVKATEMKVKVAKAVGVTDYGTMFACIDALNATDNIDLWPKTFATGHRTVIGSLKPATKYLLSAAYVGANGTKLVFCAPITIATKLI
jgi:hypothetical protein